MLSGSCDTRVLKEKNVNIWDGNSSREFLDNVGLTHIREGFIGKGYGHQFRNFNGVDQLVDVAHKLAHTPNDRRMLINLWNPADLNEMALPPCHLMYQFITTGDKLNLSFYQRSSDFVLAGNHNFLFASMFLHFFADLFGYEAGVVTHNIGDCHIYENHIEAAEEMISRDAIDGNAWLCWETPDINPDGDLRKELEVAIGGMLWENVAIAGAESHPALPKDMLEMAV